MLTIALAQLKGIPFDKKSNLTRTISTIQMCKEKGVDYVLFPELFLSGYFIQDQIQKLAETAEGESIQIIQEKAKEAGIGVIIGFPEFYKNQYYNSAAFIGKDGSLKGVYRKVHLFDKEKEFFTPGEEFPVFRTEAGNIAIMMTFDVEFPEMARIYAMNGVEMIMVLNAHSVPYEPHQEVFLRARALENQIFIAAANKVGLEGMTLYFGESAVISPEGNFLTRGGNNEELLITSVNLNDVYKVRDEQPMKYLDNRKNALYRAHGLL
ncbi:MULTISPECIES: nitrilase-related carbon-nitrogen hydrolase [Aneurinibacillus]|uniref:Carbon-nitrogen hydrolase family protein n=1 Tax=Aneurinibacillus thermoaerophilus TaxID=143495 RepID=A0A1G7ZJZ1_ANETH|nr:MULTISPECIES: nitrilase-related carbon-nitrogen hydrolase [Aneurinibacillus]AMA72410.1 carbon-nitrogen hydrolase [Aneurinibacillus sp. XH2]MED0675713.1 nitrilase-related carbon-nitrogen hydrolase [Aneurinibacillus thermoaerophilus]MED0679882.1 nitrilase-related carbon-nitrogen hydrolase [Aneurinibacillus thermoaerophilus]MED0738965.1 nitrilase-related carbon-nitrogen hydrolase [Aneurinibacillus thermoaerophilus]MED0758811.1 nitrilase-related carbon-nitrogen hydrolase [Aneurinibacillus therm